MTRRAPLLVLVLSTILLPRPAAAFFEEVLSGARGAALGASGQADISDLSAYYWNPAGLAQLPGAAVAVDYAKPYAVEDLSEGTLVAGTRWRGAGLVVAWHHFGISDVYGEDQLALAAGRTVWSRGGYRLDGGTTYKFDHVGFQPFTVQGTSSSVDYGSQSKGSLDLALQWTTPWHVDFAWVGRDVIQPRFRFIAGAGGDLLEAQQDFAAAFHWNRESVVTAAWQPGAGAAPARMNVGLEIEFYRVFLIRSGLSNLAPIVDSNASPNSLDYTGGFGIRHEGYNVDATAVTSHDLGASYRVTLTVPIRAHRSTP